MNFNTFYKLYYKHRIKKASLFLKIYLFLVIPIRYLINFFYFEKKINLDEFEKKNYYLYGKNLSFLFEFFNSDKGQQFYDQYPQPIKIDKKKKIKAHNYAKYYEKFLEPFKNKKNTILELGSFYGNASAAFYFYFKNSKIFGADLNPDMFRYNSNRVESFFVNSGSEDSIKSNKFLMNNVFDIIVEDASHMLKDQIISLFLLFPKINSGGIITKASSIDQIRTLKSPNYRVLKNLGIKIGRQHVYFPRLLSPKYNWVISLLWALKNQLHPIPELPSPGSVSVPYRIDISKQFMLVAGYTLLGNLFVRIDILEKLLGILSKETTNGEFIATSEVLNLLGCSYADFGEIIKNLGYRKFDKIKTSETKKIYLFIKEKRWKSKKNIHKEVTRKKNKNNFIAKTETPFAKLRNLEFKNTPNG